MRDLVLLLSIALISVPARADFIDTTWQVVGFEGDAWFVEPEDVVGKTQEFYKGWADGVFYACDYLGQSSTYMRLPMDEFLSNTAFADFSPAVDQMRRAGETAFVHRVTCDGNGADTRRRVLYPFVTTEARNAAFYLYEGGVFILESHQGD